MYFHEMEKKLLKGPFVSSEPIELSPWPSGPENDQTWEYLCNTATHASPKA